MKTLSVIAFVSLPVAVAVSFFSLMLAGAALFAVGLSAIMLLDYTRSARVLRLPCTVALGARRERFGLAA